MASIVTGLFKRIIKVRIEGPINQKLTDNITEGFRKAKFCIPEALVVIINSPGGSLAQAKHISDVIKNYSAKNNVPIYCFAEDQCMGSANLILTSGVKTYANQMSLIGEFNYSWSSLWFKKFAEKYNLKVNYVYSGENKVKFNPFEEIKPQSQKWMQDYLYLLEHELKCSVVDNRQKILTQKQMDKKQIEEKLFSKSIISPEDAVKYGLIDGIKNADDLLNQTFSGVKVYEVNKKDKFEYLRRFVANASALV